MIKQQTASGYILVLTLLVVSLMVVIATQIYYTSSGFTSFCQVAVARERAKMLALSGVQLIRSELCIPAPKKEKKAVSFVPQAKQSQQPAAGGAQAQPQEEQEQPPAVQLLRYVFPKLNRWQKVTIADQASTGVLSVYLACEDGKFLLNGMLTALGNKKVPENIKKCMREIMAMVAKNVGAKVDLAGSLYNFFQQRKGVWFNDVTELLTISGFEAFKDRMFVPLKQEAPEKVQAVYLTDLFTSRAGFGTLNPWVLSASVRVVLGLNQPSEGKAEGADLGSALKGFKSSFNWKTDWDKVLQPLYGKNFQSLPKGIEFLLSTNCEPMFFSVLVHAQVDGITQRLYALLSRDETRDDGSIAFNIMKIYWI